MATLGRFPETSQPAVLKSALVFRPQLGTKTIIVPEGETIKVRYNAQQGYYVGTFAKDGQSYSRKDIPLHTFEWI